MRRIRGIAIPDADLDHSWPTAALPFDPWAGDEALHMTGSFADYLSHCERIGHPADLDQARHDELDARFEMVYRSILDGCEGWSEMETLASALKVWGPRCHDRRPLPPSGKVITDAELSDMVENQLPQVGMVAPDRVLGPWADEPLPRWVRVVAAAVMGFCPEVRPGVPAWARAIKRHPRPEHDIRVAIRAMSRVPPMLWRITAEDKAVPHLPLAGPMCPDDAIKGLPDAPAVIGRLVHTGTDWVMCCGLPLPHLPPAQMLTRRLDLELLRIRRRERRLTWEVMLRERGEVLYRTCCEWLWSELASGDQAPWTGSTPLLPGPAARLPRA